METGCRTTAVLQLMVIVLHKKFSAKPSSSRSKRTYHAQVKSKQRRTAVLRRGGEGNNRHQARANQAVRLHKATHQADIIEFVAFSRSQRLALMGTSWATLIFI